MRRFFVVSSASLFLLMGSLAKATKVEEVQGAFKSAPGCGKDIASDVALRLVKDLFMSCTPDSDVDVEGCKVKCLKKNEGKVTGG